MVVKNRKRITRRIIESIANGSKDGPLIIHVAPRSNTWIVRKYGANRVTGIFNSKIEAIEKASKIVNPIKSKNTQIFIHDKKGNFIEYNPALAINSAS